MDIRAIRPGRGGFVKQSSFTGNNRRVLEDNIGASFIRKDLRSRHTGQIEQHPELVRPGMIFVELINQIEEVARLLFNIAEAYQESFSQPPRKSPERALAAIEEDLMAGK